MEIIILGSGTATPRLDRNASGVVIKTGKSTMLVDMGPGTLRRLCEAGIDFKELDVVMLTHFHPDHVSDLAPFLFAHNYAYGEMRKDHFFLLGPSGLEQLYCGLVNIYGSWVKPAGDRLKIFELKDHEPDKFVTGEIVIHSVPAEHSRPSISLRIEIHGKSVTISGDTDYSESLVLLSRNSDIFICECSMPDGQSISGHSTPSVAGKMAKEADVKKLVLTHFYPPCDLVDTVAQASLFFSGPIVKSEDLLKIKV